MSYEVIARKFRPQTFSDVLGQSHITKTLERALETKRIHHAYLFAGARGVGKTSTARILAKALNCENGPTPTPCGICKSCKEITQGISLDVREIDGASNTGVDDIRQLREDVRYLPNQSPYRIYIIDEIHMLSTSAFNALLKTLEEPPEHIIFIFATTEPHKILDTILSRCQRYDFRLLSQTQIIKQLQLICQKETTSIDESALSLLAQEAKGSMRDAETLLDQVVSFTEEKITPEIVTACLGLMDRKLVIETLKAIVNRNARDVLTLVQQIFEFGHDIKKFTELLLSELRNLGVLKALDDNPENLKDLFHLSDTEKETLYELSAQTTLSDSQRLYRLLSEDFFSITHAPNQQIALEMSLLRLVQSPPLSEISDLIQELRGMKSQIPSKHFHSSSTHPVSSSKKQEVNPFPSDEIQDEIHVKGDGFWKQFLNTLKKVDPALASALPNAHLIECSSEKIIFAVSPKSFLHEMLTEKSSKEHMIKAALKISGIRPIIDIRVEENAKKPKSENQEKRELTEQLKKHPVIQDFQTMFDAHIEDVKMTPPSESSKGNQRN